MLTGLALVIGIVGEGAGHLAHPVVCPNRCGGDRTARPDPGSAHGWAGRPPCGQYFSTDGFYKIPGGNSTFDILSVDDIRGGMDGFPDKASIEKLRYYGIRTVVLHLRMPRLPGIVGYATPSPPMPPSQPRSRSPGWA